MNIGVVTVHDVNNFGAFLQAYGLKRTLENMGYQVYHIRNYTKKYARGMFYRIRPYGGEYRHLPAFILKNLKGWRKHQVFLKDLRPFRVLEQYDPDLLDLVILGSDEIWNTTNPLFQHHAFFGEGMSPVMAYAPSIGNATMEDLSVIPTELFRRMDPILVRDDRSLEFVRSMGIEAPRVCDPTILADPAIFRRDYHHRLMKDPYLLIYAYGHEISEPMRIHILDFARSRGLKVLSVGFDLEWCDGVINCSPLDFCAVLAKAAYVVTGTFHGSIFSILNHKQFVSIPYSPKTTDLLDRVGLNGRLIDQVRMTPEKLATALDAPIDYFAVDACLAQMRDDSMKLLKQALAKHNSQKNGG